MRNLCKERKILFIHPTKCAGKSVEHAVFGFPKGGKSEHKRASDYGKGTIDKYFTFTIVRNPWDRYISQILFDGKDPNDLKEHLEGDLNPKKNNKMGILSGRSLWSYYDCLTIDGDLVIDEILRFENLDKEWEKVAEKTKVSFLPKINVNPNRKHYSHYFSKETKEMLYQLWKWDIETFGYKYEKKD